MEKKIEKISVETGIPIKELNQLNRNKWYHGTTIESACNIQKIGVIANYNLGSELDFGTGFYLTDTYERAESYISKLPITDIDGNIMKRTEWAVNEKPHGYDIIWGVMSDSFPVKLLLDYKNGITTYEETISLLQKPNSMKQLFVGKQEICDKLIITSISEVKEEIDNE